MPTLLLTGGTGALGRAFLSYSRYKGRIRILSRDEHKQHALRELNLPDVRFILGDICDVQKLAMAMRDVDVVVHMAALKVIPAGGYNADEHLRINAVGTLEVFRQAIRAGVSRVLYISSDKAVTPTTLYGMTKGIGEHLMFMCNDWSETAISAVRFGNIIDSTGSFTHTIAEWKPGDQPLGVTDERMTRFWIGQSQAIRFIDLALERMEGGEIFVPKIPAKRIIDLIPPGVPWVETGLRPTEKIHEELVAAHEVRHTDEFSTHYEIRYPPYRGNCQLQEAYTSREALSDDPEPSELAPVPKEVQDYANSGGADPTGAVLSEGE